MIDLRSPPSDPIDWICTHIGLRLGRRSVSAKTWFAARELGAAYFAVPRSEVEAVEVSA